MYGAILTFWCVIALSLFRHLNAQTYNDSVDLRTSVLSNYNAKERPVLNLTSAVNVHSYLELVSIQDIDAVSGTLTVTGFLVLSWIDEKLVWDPISYGDLSRVYFGINEIWHPILILKTSAFELNSFTANWMSVRVYSDGTTTHFPNGVFSTICNINIRYYPFDRQVCTVNLMVFAFFGDEVAINATYKEVQKNFFIDSNGEWDLESTSVETVSGGSTYSDELKFHFTLKRRSGFLIVNVLLPIIFMAYINLLVFVLPVECGERVGYAITVLLALAVFLSLVSDNLPKSSEPMSIIGYHIMVMLILSTCMIVVTTVNLKLYFKQGSVPGWCENMTKTVLCYRCKGKGDSHSGNNQVSPSEKMKDKKTASNINIEKAEKVNAPGVTWQEFSYAIDAIFLTAFFVIITLTNIIVFAILASN